MTYLSVAAFALSVISEMGSGFLFKERFAVHHLSNGTMHARILVLPRVRKRTGMCFLACHLYLRKWIDCGTGQLGPIVSMGLLSLLDLVQNRSFSARLAMQRKEKKRKIIFFSF